MTVTDNINNLLLEHLKAIRADVASLKADLKEAIVRMGRVEVSLSGLRRDMAHADEGLAEQSVRIDRISERIERIERRLDLA
jgi:septal ring factor EnvC (AmiA/AmiB activator)